MHNKQKQKKNKYGKLKAISLEFGREGNKMHMQIGVNILHLLFLK